MHASHEALTLAHPAREIRVLKRHGVSEHEGDLGADFVLPRFVGKEMREL